MDEPVPVLEPVVPRRPRQIRAVIVLLVIVAVAVVAATGVMFLARPAPSTDTPLRLVVVGTDGSLATTDGLGEVLQDGDAPGYDYQFPAWSPDGSQVAAIGRSGGLVTVDVFNADPASSGLPRRIYQSSDRPAFYLYWAPDSKHVSFLTSEPAPDDIALRIAPADGSAPADIVRAAAPFYWDFVDSSTLLLHTGSTGAQAFTGEIDLDGDSLEDAPIASGLFRAPAVSADGASRAYVSAAADDPAGGGQLVVEARDGSAHHDIPVAGAVAFGFDPTSTSLAFIAPEVPRDPPAPIPSGPLHIVDTSSGDERTVLDGNVLAFFWSPDGHTLATLDLRPADEQEPDPGHALAIGPLLGSGSISALPPLAAETPGVGLHLSFIDAEGGSVTSERDLRVSELFAFQILPYFDQYALSHRFWAPDSSAIVLPLAEEDGVDRVVVIPADGGDPRDVATGSIGFWSP
jgi:hypothetical protein